MDPLHQRHHRRPKGAVLTHARACSPPSRGPTPPGRSPRTTSTSSASRSATWPPTTWPASTPGPPRGAHGGVRRRHRSRASWPSTGSPPCPWPRRCWPCCWTIRPSTPSAFASVRQVAYGASSMAPDLLRRGTEALGVGFAQGYGMTELSGNAVFLDEEGHRAALGDRPAPPAGGRAAEPARRGPARRRRGDPRPRATGHGRLLGRARGHRGRGGRRLAPHRRPRRDRRRRATSTSWTGRRTSWSPAGRTSSSREVEDVLATHPAVGQVAVIGVPDERWGEAVCAVVVPDRAPR